jgi:MYXO-CTERM domain-containing protein
MNVFQSGLIAALSAAVMGTSAIAATFTPFAQSTPVGSKYFTVLNTGGTTTITGSGQDIFTFLVSAAISTPVLANVTFTATSTVSGVCTASACLNLDGFTQQGYSGSFSYIVASGVFTGMDLLSGTFNVTAIPSNSGGILSATIGGASIDFSATQTPSNPSAIVLSSAFVSFPTTTVLSGDWLLSGVTPAFAVDATVTLLSKPLSGQVFDPTSAATFSAAPAPEPASMALFALALAGLAPFFRRRRIAG